MRVEIRPPLLFQASPRLAVCEFQVPGLGRDHTVDEVHWGVAEAQVEGAPPAVLVDLADSCRDRLVLRVDVAVLLEA